LLNDNSTWNTNTHNKNNYLSYIYIMNTNISLKNFLKKYTAISNKFIDEYFKFYEICENNMFGIEASKIIE